MTAARWPSPRMTFRLSCPGWRTSVPTSRASVRWRGCATGMKSPAPRAAATPPARPTSSDTFLDSAWYYLRYPSTDFADRPFDEEITRRWLPVDTYIGGNEHAVLHLLYARFVAMALHDMGWIDCEEPFAQFRAHGLIIRDGAKMSKSKGNVIVPDPIIKRYGGRHLPCVPHVPGTVHGGRRLPGSGHFGPARLPPPPVGVGGAPRRRTCRWASRPRDRTATAPDHPAGDGAGCRAALQHRHRSHDGVPERGAGRGKDTGAGRNRAAGPSGRAVRAPYGRGVVAPPGETAAASSTAPTGPPSIQRRPPSAS